MFLKRIAFLGLLLLASAMCALYGSGSSYQETVTTRSSIGQFDGIAVDGWVKSGSLIQFSRLGERGNRVELQFNDWYPEGKPKADLEFSLCGAPVARHIIEPGGKYVIPLKGTCEPRRIEIKIMNPSPMSATDLRELGTQLLTARVKSRAGVPIVWWSIIGKWTAALFIVGLLLSFLPGRLAKGLALVVPVLFGLLLAYSRPLDFRNVWALWLMTSSMIVGAIISARLGPISLPPPARVLPPRFYSYLAIGVVALGAAIRFYGLDFGLPFNFHPDEVPKFNAIMRMRAAGDLNPRYFLHPSLLLYSTYAMNQLYQLVQVTPDWSDTVYIAGRTVSALAGTLSIYLTYVLGKRLFTPRVGVLAGLVLAVLPLHVTCSRYVKEDSLLTFVVLLCAVTVLKAAQENRKGLLLLGGILAGCASSTKYTGVLSVMIVFAAPWLRSGTFFPDRAFIKWTMLSLLLIPLGFFMCTPYSVLDNATFLRDFNHERSHMSKGHTHLVDAWSQIWMFHFGRSLVPGMTKVAAAIACAGVGLLIWRRQLSAWWLVALVLLFYLPAEWVKAKPAPQPERYVVPCLPFLALAAAELTRAFARAGWKWSAALLTIVLVAFPAVTTVRLANEIQPDTRVLMAEWMVDNLPAGATVAVDWKPYSPRFDHGEFDMVYLPRSRILESLDIGQLRRSGYQYLVLSSLYYSRYFTEPNGDPIGRERVRQIFRQVPIVKEIAPEYETYGFHNPTLTLFSLAKEDFEVLQEQIKLRKEGKIEKTRNEVRASFKW